MAEFSYKEISESIAVHSLKDPAFRKEFVADPTGTFEKYTGHPFNELKVFAHENSASELHFVLPPAIVEGELSDEDLEKVAGGEFVIGVAVVGLFGAIFGAVIPGVIGGVNEHTRSRQGW